MKMRMRNMLIVSGLCVCMCGCGNKVTETKNESTQAAEDVAQTTEKSKQMKTEDYFPETYSEQTEKVKFECHLEVPEDFEISDFHMPIIKGITYTDLEKIYAKYVGENIVTEEYHNDPTSENEKGDDIYILEDGTNVAFTGGFLYYNPKSTVYRQVVRDNERTAPKDEFGFASGDECVEQVREELKAIGCPVDEYQFGWFSTSGEDYAILEQRALEDGMLDSQKVKTEGWTEKDNAYEIYGWQSYEGLQVLPQWMTTAMSRAFEDYQKAPVSALYTEQGILALALSRPPYIFEASDELLEFLPFSEIADVLIQKYDNLLDEAIYTVTRAKIVLRTYYDEQQQLAAEPVWYFEVTDGNTAEVMLVHAVTGEEIFLN